MFNKLYQWGILPIILTARDLGMQIGTVEEIAEQMKPSGGESKNLPSLEFCKRVSELISEPVSRVGLGECV